MKRLIVDHWLLIIIFLLAAFLRFYQLISVPPSLNWDETALGYNAYSILKTGKDEYGKFLPLVFKSFGDFKPGIYVYLTVPFVALFDLSEFAVRAPSALFGVLTVGILFFLVKELFGNKKIALIAAFFLAISPWHLLLSRPAFEANIALFLNLLGIFFFLKFIKKRTIFSFLFFAFSFLISLYTYQVSKLIVPLFTIGLILFWFREVIGLPKKYFLIAFGFLLLAFPIYYGSIFGSQGGRFEVFSVFSYPSTGQMMEKLAKEDETTVGSLPFQFFHSQPYQFGRTILSNYLNHLSPRFLFFEGDFQNQRTKIPDNGMMYFFDIVFLLFGLYAFFKTKLDRQKYFLLFWLAVSPLPAALTRDQVSPIRAFNLVVPLVILSAFGAWFLLEKIKTLPKIPFLILAVFGVLMFWNISFLLDSYFIHYPKIASREWLYGYKEAVEVAQQNYNDFKKIIFTTVYNEPYIFVLFDTKYPPAKYQPQAKLRYLRGPLDVGEVMGFDKFDFRAVNYPGDLDLKNTLLVAGANEIPPDELERDVRLGKVEIVKEINFLDGSPAFRIVAVKNAT